MMLINMDYYVVREKEVELKGNEFVGVMGSVYQVRNLKRVKGVIIYTAKIK